MWFTWKYIVLEETNRTKVLTINFIPCLRSHEADGSVKFQRISIFFEKFVILFLSYLEWVVFSFEFHSNLSFFSIEAIFICNATFFTIYNSSIINRLFLDFQSFNFSKAQWKFLTKLTIGIGPHQTRKSHTKVNLLKSLALESSLFKKNCLG